MQLTIDNIAEAIESGYIYRSTTPSGWARIECNTRAPGYRDDPLSFSYPVDMPEVPALVEAWKEREEAKNNALVADWREKFGAMTSGLKLIKGANDVKHEERERFNLFGASDNRLDPEVAFAAIESHLLARDEYGSWYHGWTRAKRRASGRVEVTYGGYFDLWVPAGDVAAGWERA
jgi:hypothetical protein